MAKEIKAWACSFNCGRAVLTKRKAMESHEARCFSNPASKSCKTCSLQRFEPRDEECGIAGGFYCEDDRIPRDQTARTNCEYWREAKR